MMTFMRLLWVPMVLSSFLVVTTTGLSMSPILSSWIPCWSPASYFVGKWNPVFPPSMKRIEDMVITVEENETLTVDYKGSVVKAKWKLYPNIHLSNKHYHRMMVHQIEFVRPPYLQYFKEVTKHMRMGTVFKRFGIYVDFPILPLSMVLPVVSGLNTCKEGDMWVIDTVEFSKDEMVMGGDWKSGNEYHGKIYFLRLHH
jgi:hypothetical protein